MEIAQTGTNPGPWCMGMFGARFAVFVRRARVLPDPCHATRNLSFLRFHRHRHTVVSSCCFAGLVRVGMKIAQDGNRANVYEHVAVVHGHVWRTVCSVCATSARVARPVPAPSPCCFNLLFTGMVRVGAKIPQDGNRANTYEHVAVVHEHVWRTLCSVCATGALVARPVPCNS